MQSNDVDVEIGQSIAPLTRQPITANKHKLALDGTDGQTN